MIVRMMKVTLLVSAGGREEALRRLGELGILHVDTQTTTASTSDHALEAERTELNTALHSLDSIETLAKAGEGMSECSQPNECVTRVLALARQRELLGAEEEEIEDQLRWYRDWGNISPKSIEKLRKAGISVRFHLVDKKGLSALSAEQIVHVGKETGRGKYCVAAIGEVGEDGNGNFVEHDMPVEELAALKTRLDDVRLRLAAVLAELGRLTSVRETLLVYRSELARQMEFNRVQASMGLEGHIAYLEGFCPADSVQALETVSRRARAGAALWKSRKIKVRYPCSYARPGGCSSSIRSSASWERRQVTRSTTSVSGFYSLSACFSPCSSEMPDTDCFSWRETSF